MTLFLNVFFAWLSVVLVFILSVIYLLRIINKKVFDNRVQWMKTLNRALRKHHKWIGLAAIVTSLIHGYFSTTEILSPNKGTIMFVLMILLGMTYMVRKALKKIKGFFFYHRILTGLTLAFFCLHLIEVGGIIGPRGFYEGLVYEMGDTLTSSTNIMGDSEDVESDPAHDEHDVVETISEETDLETDMTEAVTEQLDPGNVYTDGVYTGEATGYRDGLVVEVTIEDKQIILVEVVDHNEKNERFYGPPIEILPGEIVATQYPVVDTVSGATMTSIGIINATINALEQALESGTLPEYLDLPTRGH